MRSVNAHIPKGAGIIKIGGVIVHCLIIVIMFCCFSIPAYGEYYKYTDSNGSVAFTDDPGAVPMGQRSEIVNINDSGINEPVPRRHNPASNSLQDNDSLKEREDQDEYIIKQPRQHDGKSYNAKESCPDETKIQARQAIESTWRGMSEAMISGNLEKALGFFTVFFRDEMKRRMSGMKEEEIKIIFGSFKSIEISSLYENDGIAEGGIIREEASGTYSYPASFVRGQDCEWRITGF